MAHTHPFLLRIVHWSFHATGAEVSSCNRNHMTRKRLNYFRSSHLQKMFADPDLGYSVVTLWIL